MGPFNLSQSIVRRAKNPTSPQHILFPNKSGLLLLIVPEHHLSHSLCLNTNPFLSLFFFFLLYPLLNPLPLKEAVIGIHLCEMGHPSIM